MNNLSFKDNYDYVIIGAGIAGLMLAFGIEQINSNATIAIIESGNELDNRKCPIKNNKTKCMNCSTCSIMSGIAGAGAFSDAKFNITTEYGGWLNEYIGDSEALKYMNILDNILCRFSNNSYFEANYKLYEPNNYLKKRALEYDLHLLQGKVRHFGTDGIYYIMKNLYSHLKSNKNITFIQRYINPDNISLENKKINLNPVLIPDRGM